MNLKRLVLLISLLLGCAVAAPPLLRSGPDPADPNAPEAPLAARSLREPAPVLPDAGAREVPGAAMHHQHHHGGSSDGGSP